MKKLIIAPVLTLAMTVGTMVPAFAQTGGGEPIMSSHGIIAVLIGLLLPAV